MKEIYEVELELSKKRIEELEKELKELKLRNEWRKDTIEHVDKKLEFLKGKKYAIGVKELETIKYLLGSDD